MNFAQIYAAQEAWERNVATRDIFSPTRLPHVVAARTAVMRRLRDDGYSLMAIGRMMGRHHSTVIHALRKAA